MMNSYTANQVRGESNRCIAMRALTIDEIDLVSGGEPFCVTLPIFAPLPIGWMSISGNLDTVVMHALIGAVAGFLLDGAIGAAIAAIAGAGTAVDYEVYLFQRLPPEGCP